MNPPTDADLHAVITGSLQHCHAAAAEHGRTLNSIEVALIRMAAVKAAVLTSELLVSLADEKVIAAVIDHAIRPGAAR